MASEAALRELLGVPSDLVVRKQLSALDQHCRAFIALAPFLTIATTSATGACDVSPRGDAPGFVAVLDDHTLAIPERPGNRRFDTLRNIIETGTVGLLFIIPGIEETLRVNGRAALTRDAALLERLTVHGKPPWLAIGIEIDECFLHCAKAFKRSHLWDPATWPERAALPSLARMLIDQVCLPSSALDEMTARIEESYTRRLY